MKNASLGQLAMEQRQSLLVGSYQGHEIQKFDKGGFAEKFSVLVGKRVIDVAVFPVKGTDPASVKVPAWPIGCKVVATDVGIEAGDYGLNARAKSVLMLE